MSDNDRINHDIHELDLLRESLSSAYRAAEISADAGQTGLTDASRARRRRNRTWRIAGAAGIACLAVAAVMLTAPGRKTVLRAALPKLSLDLTVARIADAAASNQLGFAASDQYFYARREATHTSGAVLGQPDGSNIVFRSMVKETSESWVSLERVGALKWAQKQVTFPTARDRALATKFLGPSATKPQTPIGRMSPTYFNYLGTETFTRTELLEYPTDPRAIYRRIGSHLSHERKSRAEGIWEALREPMDTTSLPPELRAGMIKALALIPGVESLGPKKDKLGREGYAIAYTHPSGLPGERVRDELLFDPQTSEQLYERTVVVKAGSGPWSWPVGTVTNDSLLIHSGVVDDLPKRLVAAVSKGRLPAAAISQDNRLAASAHKREAAALARLRAEGGK